MGTCGKEFAALPPSMDAQRRTATPQSTLDASPRSQAQERRLQAAFGSLLNAQAQTDVQRASQAPVQRFQNIVLAGSQIRQFGPPAGPAYVFINSSLAQLQTLLNSFGVFEAQSLLMVQYLPEAQQHAVLTDAVQRLGAIHDRATLTRQFIAGDQAYAAIAADLVDVLATAQQDQADRQLQLQAAANELVAANNAAWALWHPGPPPTAAALAAAFDRARSAGIVTVLPRHWWSTDNYRGPNAEMEIRINNAPWALVHVKWDNQAAISFANVNLANFKPPYGGTITNSVIPDTPARTHLILQALNCSNSAPPPQTPGNVPMV